MIFNKNIFNKVFILEGIDNLIVGGFFDVLRLRILFFKLLFFILGYFIVIRKNV